MRESAGRSLIMNEKIKEAITDLFEKAPESQEVLELQEEMISNAEEKYNDLIQRGFTEEQAYTMVMASIGDVEELLADLGGQDAQDGEEAADQEGKQSEYWEKQGEYWRWQGEYWEKQARNFGQQAKDAFNTIVESNIWESIASSVKQIIGDVGSSMQTESGEYTDMALYNERRFAADGVKSLVAEIQSSPVDLDVQLTTDSEVLVQEFYNKEPQESQMLEYTVCGSQLKLQYAAGTLGLSRKGIVRIFLPEDFAGSLEEFRAVTVSGDITMEDIGAAKQNIRTMSGDIKGKAAIGDVNVSTVSGNISFDLVDGNCQIKTASGDIQIGKMAGKICQNSASGDVAIGALEGEGAFHTASGDIAVNVTVAGEKLDFGTASGDVEVTLPADTSVQMTLNTASGDIDTFCDKIGSTEEHVDYVKHGRHAVGTVGEEPFLQLKVNTASGDITVRR